MSNFFTPEFNNASAIAPWNASLEPTKAIIPQLDANRVLTGGIGQEVNIPTLTPEAYDNIILPDAALTRMASAVSTDSNSSLPDSSVDLLTGQAMSEVYGDLSKFAADPDFAAKLNVPFGENWDAAGAKALAEGWFNRDFSDIPPVKVVSSAEIGGANGAFAEATDTIYVSREFLTGNAANPAAVADVLREEIGHSVDARLNVTDSLGDEGAIFSRVVQGKELSEGELQGLKSKDDRGTAIIDGKILSVEYATNDDINEYYSKNWAIRAYNANTNSRTWEPVLWSGEDIRGFGSNTRSDGKKGFTGDWGYTSPVDGVNQDNFYLQFWTQADFQQGGTYNFNVRADDDYALLAFPVGANNKNQYEPIGEYWKGDAFGGKTIQFTPKNNGKYWVVAYYLEKANTAYFDISWEKTGQAQSNSVPNGFTSVKSAQGVNLYEGNNKSDYVQVVDLSQGASIKLLIGEKDNNTSSGTIPKFKHKKIDDFWNDLKTSNSNAFSIANGAFFTDFWYDPRILQGATFDDKTNLSYPIKIDNQTFDGSLTSLENLGTKLKLEIWNDRASITQFNDSIDSIINSSASQVLVGAPIQTNGQKNNPNDQDGRTYVGVEDRDSNGSNETVLILTSQDNTQTIPGAVKILKDFGVNENEIMQLDGSGSSQLIAQGDTPFVPGDGRRIPQTIGVVSGS